MNIPAQQVKDLREQSGAGVMECRNALLEVEGNIAQALGLLKERSLVKAEKKKDRTTSQGLVECYIHNRGRIGALVEVNCETDFAAQTDIFKELARELAMQIAAMTPIYVCVEDAAEDEEVNAETDCLLNQAYIRNPEMTVQDLINEAIAKIGENIKVGKFARFALGE